MSSRRLHDRVCRLDQLLRSGQVFALRDLARNLAVTERTLYRDLAYMKNTLGLPISRHPAHGYRYTRPVPPLESRDTVTGLRAMGQAPQALKPTHLRRLLEAVHGALYERRTVWIALADRREADEGFLLNPLFLSKINGETLLFGVRTSDGALLNLPTRRLEDVRLTPSTFEEPFAGEAKVRESEGWGAPGSLHAVRLRFPSSPQWVRDLLVSEDQSMEESHPALVLSFRTDDLARTAALVKLLGPFVRVEGPPQLQALLGRTAER